jgi:PiT family inorganic phosphate transporter
MLRSKIVGNNYRRKLRGIRWGLASNIVWAWVLTIPASAGIGVGCVKLFQAAGVI